MTYSPSISSSVLIFPLVSSISQSVFIGRHCKTFSHGYGCNFFITAVLYNCENVLSVAHLFSIYLSSLLHSKFNGVDHVNTSNSCRKWLHASCFCPRLYIPLVRNIRRAGISSPNPACWKMGRDAKFPG